MQITQILIDKLKPYSKNAKKHPKNQVEQIANSIKEFGFNQPVVVDKNNEIIVGHGRIEAAKLLGLKEVPVLKLENLTEAQIKAYRLADNKLNESDWEMKLVIDELKELNADNFDITLTGFDKDLIIESDEKDDQIPENAPTVAKLGDIWALGRHRVMCGDSTKLEDVERLMDGQKADMVFTDPPYGVSYEKKNNEVLGNKSYSKIENDDIKGEELGEFFYKAFSSFATFLKNGGSYYVCAPQGGLQMMMMMMMMEKAGIAMKHELMWLKPSPVFSMGRLDYDYQHEPILYGWRGSHQFIGNGEHKKSIWKIDRESNKSHPTMKPTALCANGILNSSKEEDIVMDLFLGSGSTLIACEKTNRICYGMELDPKYMDVIIKRWEDYTGQKATKVC